mgnify:FL=1
MEDGADKQPDATLTAEKPQTPKESRTSYTREDVDKAVRDARSAALADIGRFKTESQNALKAAQAAQERVSQMLKEQEARELDEARDDPTRLSVVQERQRRRAIESELNLTRQQLNEANAKAEESQAKYAQVTRGQIVKDVSLRFNVDATRLEKLARLTDGSIEQIEDVAKDLSPRSVLKPDSGSTIGGIGSWEQVRDAFIKNPRDPAIKRRYLEMRTQRG